MRDGPDPRWTVAGDWLVLEGSGSLDNGDDVLVVEILPFPFPCSGGLYETGTDSSGGYPVILDTICTDCAFLGFNGDACLIGVFIIMLSMLIPLESNMEVFPDEDVCMNEFGSSTNRFMQASSD